MLVEVEIRRREPQLKRLAQPVYRRIDREPDAERITDLPRACSRYGGSECLCDESEVDEGCEHDVQLVVAREDASEGLEATEEAFDLVSAAVEPCVVRPGPSAVGLGRHGRVESQIHGELSGFVAFVGSIHDDRDRVLGPGQALEKGSAFGRISALPGRQGEGDGSPIIRGNHMNLGAPSSARAPDRLRAVFFSAPVPSGCTWTMVLSKESASTRMRMISSS